MAHRLAQEFLPDYASPFSRHDFTLPQLWACLVLKEQQGGSYRDAEALLRDSPDWRAAIGLTKTPDHNTLWRAAKFLLAKGHTERFLDTVARWAVRGRLLGVSKKPLVVDTTYFESRHVSRHYEQRCRKIQQEKRRKTPRRGRGNPRPPAPRPRRADTVRGLPKLALAASGHSHLILACQTTTGACGDQLHWPGLLADLRRRLPYKRLKLVADPGFDSHAAHQLARGKLGIASLVPAASGYQAYHPKHTPSSPYRRQMQRQLATKAGRKACGYSQRAQAETVNSMVKRNGGSATRGQTAWSRKRDLHLKVITHDVMV